MKTFNRSARSEFQAASDRLNDHVRCYWEQNPCGTGKTVTGNLDPKSLAWFERTEEHRYNVEPFIHSVAQFSRYHGKKILEVGVGAGTDHLQWARAGAHCYGVDLTRAAIEITKARLSTYGFESNLQCIDAEALPFPDEFFDIVYSWGVIHHSENPDYIIKEIKRILKPGCNFIGMMYNRHSLHVLRTWIRHALFKGKPWRSFADVIWHHVESVGTKAYTISELRELFAEFSSFSAKPFLVPYDTRRVPVWLSKFFPDQWGWFLALKATK